MSLVEIRASLTCDGCGRTFSVAMDPASSVPSDWTLFDDATDAVRGSVSYKGPNGVNGCLGMSAVVDNEHLCGECADKCGDCQRCHAVGTFDGMKCGNCGGTGYGHRKRDL